jgi:hypothetical protein
MYWKLSRNEKPQEKQSNMIASGDRWSWPNFMGRHFSEHCGDGSRSRGHWCKLMPCVPKYTHAAWYGAWRLRGWSCSYVQLSAIAEPVPTWIEQELESPASNKKNQTIWFVKLECPVSLILVAVSGAAGVDEEVIPPVKRRLNGIEERSTTNIHNKHRGCGSGY